MEALVHMSITLSLPPETERKLREQAAQSGKEVSEYIQTLLLKVVEGMEAPTPTSQEVASVHAGMTFDEIAAPIRREIEHSGMTEEEVLQMIDEAKEAARSERRRRREGRTHNG